MVMWFMFDHVPLFEVAKGEFEKYDKKTVIESHSCNLQLRCRLSKLLCIGVQLTFTSHQ